MPSDIHHSDTVCDDGASLLDRRVVPILAAARASIAAQGVHNARMEDIAKRAGIAKGTLYLTFESKDQLLDALVADAVSRVRMGPPSESGLTRTVFRRALEHFLHELASNPVSVAIQIIKHRSITDLVQFHRFFRDLSYGHQEYLTVLGPLATPSNNPDGLSSRALLRLLFLNTLFYADVTETAWLKAEGQDTIFCLAGLGGQASQVRPSTPSTTSHFQ
ncbi:TetR/AcrR family transcriptional regulator [uncultured Algimonas sp.]|uniref:TetR/AcrR family transcriptional regulator n=1 Tax=uncultured Algimonas sp. TaxID=1547920 RepID=UPI0026250D65|nr:TetR/AcrR family transcriptional regulator [uncultured Algimonas sp.]